MIRNKTKIMFQKLITADSHTFVLKWKTVLSSLSGPTVHSSLSTLPSAHIANIISPDREDTQDIFIPLFTA